MQYEVRPPTLPDLPVILELLTTTEIAEFGSADWTADLLREQWTEPALELSHNVFVAWTGDTPIAYGLVIDRHGAGRVQSDHYVRPGEEHWPAGRAVLERMVARAGELAKQSGHDEVTLTMGQMVGAAFAGRVLPDAGWHIGRLFNRMARPLSELDTSPVPLPEGVTIRNVTNSDDRRSYHRIDTDSFSEHWGSEKESYDAFMRLVATWETNDWSLWWVASAGGEDVGCLRARPWADGAGFIDTVGVLKSARGQGIGSAMLRVAFAEFARRGYTRAELMVDTDNATGALHVYEAVGMTLTWQADIWERRVLAG